jgi:hypothetical protein
VADNSLESGIHANSEGVITQKQTELPEVFRGNGGRAGAIWRYTMGRTFLAHGRKGRRFSLKNSALLKKKGPVNITEPFVD